MAKIRRIFEPIQVGRLTLRNRIKMPAMAVVPPESEEVMISRLKAFYAERAKGGVALIGASCTATRLIQDPMLPLYEDRAVPALRQLTETVHAHGALMYAQMGVGYCFAFADGPVEVVGPSGVSLSGRPGTPFRMGGPFEPTMPRALTLEEIHLMAEAYGDGARRVREAGFDAVEVIASVGYVIAQFLSPLTNKRTDKYGGSLENRMQLLLEIVENMKKKAGEDYTYLCRLSGADLLPGGYTISDTIKMAQMLEKAGIHQVDLMSGWHTASVPMIQTDVPQGSWVYFADEVKKNVGIPVAAGTQLQEVVLAEKVLLHGHADMVYMARALIADPELPNKAKAGRIKDIRPCMNCCHCMEDSDSPPILCSVNARQSREWEYPAETAAAKSKRVLVIGGGPAGMEAARIASLRGHKVSLCESGPKLGGTLLLAAVTNRRIGNVVKFLDRQTRKLPIDLRLNTEVTPALLDQLKPDALVVAAGGSAPSLDVPGGNGVSVLEHRDIKQVLSGRGLSKGGPVKRALSSFGGLLMRYAYNPAVIRWLLRFRFPFGKQVAIVGGGFAGCELGVTLVGRGKKVSIIEASRRIGSDVGMIHRWVWMKQLKEAEVRLLTEARVLEVTPKGVKIGRAGGTDFVEADTVVVAGGLEPNSVLADLFTGKAPEVYIIGDCAEPGKLLEATASGFLVGQKI